MEFESNVSANALRKKCKHSGLVENFSRKCDAVQFFNASMDALGMFATSCDTFVALLNEFGTTQSQKDYVLKSMTSITIRCTCYIFCTPNKSWNDPDHLEHNSGQIVYHASLVYTLLQFPNRNVKTAILFL